MGDVCRFPSARELKVISALKNMDDDLFQDFCTVIKNSKGFFYFHQGNDTEEAVIITQEHNHLIKRERERRNGK